jgi:TrmH family RNA methyltransferase
LKKNRKREGLFIAEGPKVVGDLLQAGYKARMLLATVEYPQAERISEEELHKISFLQHPQEILAVFEIPPTINFKLLTLNFKLSLALDGVQDPGNLGTIIRIADWFGISTIYCSLDTADAYNPKVVQATMGSLAHVQVIYTDLLELFRQLPPSYPVYGTLLDGENIYKQELTNEGIIVMGNEGNGISVMVESMVTDKLLIPSFPEGSVTSESLNVAVATAIVCSEFRRC